MLPTFLPKTAVPTVSNALDAKSAFQGLMDSYSDYQKTKQREMTNREAIRADRDITLARIKSQKEVLELYLKETFKERRDMLNQMFKALDKGLETGDIDVINSSLGGIIAVAKESPLAQARQMLVDVKDPNVKSLDW